MKVLIYVILAVSVSRASYAQQTDNTAALTSALKAYSEAKSLGHKADSYLHAKNAHDIASVLYKKNPAQYASHLLTYARAAAAYREPVALELFKRYLDLSKDTNSGGQTALIIPLIDSADEALSRKKHELAYAWYQQASAIYDRMRRDDAIEKGRIHLGLSRLYLNAGDVTRAVSNARTARDLFSRVPHVPSMRTAKMMYWLGQAERASQNNQAARDAYSAALSILQTHDPDNRRILTLHRRLVEIQHKLGNIDAATAHCIDYEKWNSSHNWLEWGPVYDPAERLTPASKIKTGQILAAYKRSAACKAEDIKIYKTIGIDFDAARALISNAYISPRMTNGTLHTDQSVQQINIDVYEQY